MELSESEFYEAGLSLPPDVRKHVALRLLESVDPQEAFDLASDSWLRTEAAAAYDALEADPAGAIPAKNVGASFEANWAGGPSTVQQSANSPQGVRPRPILANDA